MAPTHMVSDHQNNPTKREALKEEKPRFRALFENSFDAILLTIPDGSILSANPAACRMFDRTEDEILRLGRNGVIDPSDPRLAPALEERARTGRFHGDLTLVRKDGTKFQGEVSSVVFMDGDGLEKTSMIIRDITERKRIEETLRHNDEMLKEAQSLSHIGHWQWDIKAGKLSWSEEIFRIFGVDPQSFSVSAENFEKTIHPDDLASFLQKRERMLSEESEAEIGHRIIRPDGEVRYVLERSKVMRDDSGNVVYVIGTVQDVTERMRADEVLRNSEERLDLAVQSARLGLWDQDFENDVIHRNSIWSEMLGYDPKEIEMNKNAYLSLIHPDDFQKVKEKIEEHESGKSDIFYVENRMKTKNNDWKWVLNTGKIIKRSLDGKPLRAIGVHIDIHDQKQAIESLRKSEEMLSGAQSLAHIGHWIWNLTTGKLSWSDEVFRIFGFTPQSFSVSAEIFDKTIHPDDLASFLLARELMLVKESGVEIGHRLIRSDGEVRHVLERAKVTRDGSGNALYVMGTIQDVTERLRVQEVLRESEARYRELFNHINNGVSVYEARADGADFVFMDFNKASERMDHIKKEDLIGQSVVQVFPGVIEFGLFDVFQRVWKTGKPESHPISFYTDGRISGWRENYIYKLPSGEIVAVWDDITERKQAERNFIQLSERYQKLFENSGTGIVIVDENGKYLLVNKIAAGNLGKTMKEVIGKSMFDFLPRELAERYLEQNRRLIQTGGRREYEDTFQLPAGEHTFLIVDQSLQDENGRYFAIQSSSIDITKHHRLEKAIHAASLYTRNLIEVSLDPLVTISANGKVMDVNKATELVTGVTREKLIGTEFSDYFTEPQKAKKGFRNVFKTGSIKDYPLSIRHQSGQLTDVLYNASVFRNEAGEIQGVFAAARDITERKRIEEDLRLESEILTHMVESVHLVRVTDGAIVYTNQRFESMFGYDPGELIGKHVSIVNAPGEKSSEAVANEIIRSLKQAEGVWSGEVHNIRKDGHSFWCYANVSTFKHSQYGEVWISVNRDITDRKRAEVALRESEEKFFKTFHSNPHIITITTYKRSKIIEVNDGFLKTTGFTHEEVINRSAIELGLWARIEDRVKILRRLKKQGKITNLELNFRTKSGEIRTGLFSFEKINIGSVPHIITVISDITERKRAEESLRESEIKYRSLFENSMVGIFQISHEGRLLKINSAFAKMFGYQNPEEMIREISDIGAQLYVNPDQHNHIFRQLAERKVIEQREFEMVRRDGSRFWMLLTAIEEREPKSMFLYYEGTAIDITERVWAIEELGINQEKLRELTARLMHTQESERKRIARELHDELGQALTAVKINLVEMQKEIPSGTRSDVGARLIETDAMIENMLEQIHQMALDLRPALLDDLGLVPTLRWYAKHFKKRTGLDVRLDTGRMAARMHSDLETAVFRIVQEALTNIAKHADAAHVQIRIQRKRSVFTLSITDDGKGFDVKILESKRNRTGMGLIGIRERVTSLNGGLKIESSLGHGTTLLVSLPLKGMVNG